VGQDLRPELLDGGAADGLTAGRVGHDRVFLVEGGQAGGIAGVGPLHEQAGEVLGLPGLLVAGEAVGGANGANRLSGNAITEAFVFGRQAGRTAAARAAAMKTVPAPDSAATAAADLIRSAPPKDMPNSAEMLQRLQATMSDDVGPLRTGDKLKRALGKIDELTSALGDRPFGDGGAFDMQRLDWFDLRNMLTVARAVTQAASLRTESRGAHQREDFPEMLPHWRVNQVIRLRGEELDITQAPASPVEVAAQ
jgi:succinate dehydrogenase/fumarate reductase flavoprotein subunit